MKKRSSLELGASFIEFAITLPVFLIIIIIGEEIVRLAFAHASLTHAISRAGRYASLGFGSDTDDPVQTVRDLIDELYSPGLPSAEETGVTDSFFKMCVESRDCEASEYSRGAQAQWVYIEVNVPTSILMIEDLIPLKASIVIQNEPKFNTIPIGVGDEEDESHCFAAGTPIAMSDGSQKPIELIKAGDAVLSFKQETGENVISTVEVVMPERVANEYYVLNGHIKVTAKHPFYVSGEWKEVKDLNIGDYLRTINGKALKLTSKELIEEQLDIFNFTVSSTHSYFAHGILVHNKDAFEDEEGGYYFY